MNPFTEDFKQSVASIGEVELLKHIRQWLANAAPAAPRGMGDDCAVIPSDSNLMTVDSLVYGRHYDDSASPEQVGAKLLKRNISDIASMGGISKYAVVALMLPGETSLLWLEAFTRGLSSCALEFGVEICGGDLTETPGFLGASLTLTGEAPKPLQRKGAAVGDFVYVTGSLGGSLLGKHLDFIPRVKEALFLSEQEGIRSCIDVTDGLSKDLVSLLEKGIAVKLKDLPISEAAEEMAASSGKSVFEHAMRDGEDYELLFVLSSKVDADEFRKSWDSKLGTPLTCIGEIVESAKACLLGFDGEEIKLNLGYEHFRKA